MNSFLIALQFITRIPVNKELEYDDRSVGASMAYYPMVGTLLGLILVLINYIGGFYLSNLVCSILILIGMVALTGGIHLDGLMDSADGLLSGGDREKMLEIMRDSRVGAFGVIVLVTLFLLKLALLIELPIENKNFVLIFFPTLSRWTMVYLAYSYPYARENGLGKVYSQELKLKELLFATLWTLLLALIFFRVEGLIILGSVYIAIVKIANKVRSKIGGMTGDIYGGVNEMVEVFSLLIINLLS